MCVEQTKMKGKHFGFGNLAWDVPKAKSIVRDGRDTVPLAVGTLMGAFAWRPDGHREVAMVGNAVGVFPMNIVIDETRLSRVDPDEPGIMAFAVDEFILIDGHHRVLRCAQLGRDVFRVFCLNPDESDRCLDRQSRDLLRHFRRQAMVQAATLGGSDTAPDQSRVLSQRTESNGNTC